MAVIDRVPAELKGANTPFARISPRGILTVEVDGLARGEDVSATQPAAAWLTTVRLPVTATTSVGRPFTPATANVTGVNGLRGPATPRPIRESTNRVGPKGTYAAPDAAAVQCGH